jgi:hypothetical protein
MHLIEKQPEEHTEKANVFEGIREVPQWHKWMDHVIRLAAALSIIDILYRLLPG